MVVLSVAIVNSGKTLLARQFVEMTRLRVEGFLSAFPKLIDTGRDHTFIETETVRYVYQPMGSLYLLLVTNRSSNILEDLETLRLLAKVVQDSCQIQVNEEHVLKHALDIVFAFDEVISFGHRENVTLSQVKTYTEMESHQEKRQQMIEQSKINAAREMAKQKQMELAKVHANQPKDNSSSSARVGPWPSISSSAMHETMSTNPSPEVPVAPWANSTSVDDSGSIPLKPRAPQKSMKLYKKKPSDFFGPIIGEPTSAAAEAAVEEIEPATLAIVNPLLDAVKLDIDEQIKAKLQVEGGLSGEAECIGEFRVTVLDTSKADLVCFKLAPQDQTFKYKVHPNLNKQSHANNTLEVRDASKAYRANQGMPLLKWKLTTSNEEFLPISLSCWPSQTADGTTIVVEYELTASNICLEDIHFVFPCPPSGRPVIVNADPGQAVYDANSQQVLWAIPSIDAKEGSVGTLEFIAEADVATLLPYHFQALRRGACMCTMEILECYHQERKEPVTYHLTQTSTYTFTVGA